MNNTSLILKAIQARTHAYAPYSKHRVGAALLTKSGKIYLGANVENCVFPLGDCAERVAIYKAVSDGEREFSKIAVVTGNKELSPPCGSCRQVMNEFNPSLEVIVSNPDKKYKIYYLQDLLPFSFGPLSLRKGRD